MTTPGNAVERAQDVELPTTDDGFVENADEIWFRPSGPEFRPSKTRPIPVVRCHGVVRNGPRVGRRCGRPALLGANVCLVHGGHLPGVRKKAAAIVTAARMALLDDAGTAARVLVELTQPGTSDAVRLKAATEILDRVGVRGGFEVSAQVEVATDAANVLRARLERLGHNLSASENAPVRAKDVVSAANVVDAELADAEPVDAELVDDADSSDNPAPPLRPEES